MFEQAEFDDAVGFRDADVGAEGAESFRGVAAAAETGEGGHAGIVPAGDEAFLHEQEKFTFAEEGVGDVEAVELELLGMVDTEVFDVPIVEGAVVFKFQGANRVGNAFDGVAFAVGVVVHRVDAPLVAGTVMVGVEDTIHDGVAHVEIGRGHVDFGAEGAGSVGEFAGAHAFEEIEIVFDGAVSEGAGGSGFGGGAAGGANLLRG